MEEEAQMPGLSREQRDQVTTVEVWNCAHAFEFVCPRYFSSLEPTDDPATRFCGACRERVYVCLTPQEFVSHAERGHCVCIPEGFAPLGLLCTEWLGWPSRQTVEAHERHLQDVRAWWQGVLAGRPPIEPEALAEVARLVKPGAADAPARPAHTA
jgi:hypothetical protein